MAQSAKCRRVSQAQGDLPINRCAHQPRGSLISIIRYYGGFVVKMWLVNSLATNDEFGPQSLFPLRTWGRSGEWNLQVILSRFEAWTSLKGSWVSRLGFSLMVPLGDDGDSGGWVLVEGSRRLNTWLWREYLDLGPFLTSYSTLLTSWLEQFCRQGTIDWK